MIWSNPKKKTFVLNHMNLTFSRQDIEAMLQIVNMKLLILWLALSRGGADQARAGEVFICQMVTMTTFKLLSISGFDQLLKY